MPALDDPLLAGVALAAQLTPAQRKAVVHRGSNLLVEAVPGSGKTHVIVARCESLLADGIPGSAILLLTFSRRAVEELQARLSRALPHKTIPEIRTFHGFAARLLADDGPTSGSRRLLSEPAERALFEHVAASTPLLSLPAGIGRSPQFRDVASVRVDQIRRAPLEALARLTRRATPRIADLLALDATQKGLRETLGVADYDDLVARSVALAATARNAVATTIRSRYAHVLVDEFQDTDALQLALLQQLDAEIFAVGDAAQAIYGFRGAARDALARSRVSLSMSALSLDESFRCPANICDVARAVWPLPPRLYSGISEAGEIVFARARTPQDEAALLAASIEEAIIRGTPESEIAVLVRSAEPMVRLIERELHARGIPAVRQGGEKLLDDLAVDAICAVLRAFAAPSETERWIELLGHPVFDIPPLVLRKALDANPPRGVDDACRLVERLQATARVSGARMANALRRALVYWEANDPAGAARNFAAEADVLGYVVATDESDAQCSGARIQGFLEGLADVDDVRKRLNADPSSASVFAAFVAGSSTWRAVATPLSDKPGVRILTVHAAKGLEFDMVAIADAVDNRFPQRWRSDELLNADELTLARECGVDLGTRLDEHDDEERSLWYVAVTRAKRKLLVTWSETDVDGSPQRPSRFIPLDARARAAQNASFGGLFAYPAVALRDPQNASAARLERPISTSTMDIWFTCRRKFFYGALLRIGSDERSFKAKLGTLIHRAIEEFHATFRDFRGVELGAHLAWSASLISSAQRLLTSADAKLEPFGSPLETEAAMRSARRLLGRYARELEESARSAAGGFEVVANEERVKFSVDGIAFSGKIDRIDRLADGTLALVDVKTGAFTKERAMATAFINLAAAVSSGSLWMKAPPPGNPQLALYRHAKPQTQTLAYIYLEARPKAAEYIDAAHADRLALKGASAAVAAIDTALSTTFFEPWKSGAFTSLEPTRYARTCRTCEFVTVCPGYLEDDD